MNNELLEPVEPLTQADVNETSAIDTFTVLKGTGAADVVQALQNREIMAVANTDEQVKDKLNANAKDIIQTHTQTIAQDTKRENQEANYRVNRFACKIYGVDESCPLWQQRLMKIGAAFWFIIYWLFASLTIVPINTFLQMVGNIIKNNFCKWLLSILFYAILLFIAVGVPILISYIQSL